MKTNSIPIFYKKASLYIFISCVFLTSCTSGKYTYFFDTGRHIDFSQGKWLINEPISNSKVFNNELGNASIEGFSKILGTSLADIKEVRRAKLIGPTIDFDLSPSQLKQLYVDTGCDYLINVKGNIISNGGGALGFQSSGYSESYAANSAIVHFQIYNLKEGVLISSSSVQGKSIDHRDAFNNSNHHLPTILSSAETMMVAGAKKLIKKYDKYSIKK